MKNWEVRLTDGAIQDIDSAVMFYDGIQYGLGEYFFDSIMADIEALELLGGVHQQRFGHHACPAKRFPFIVYYQISDTFLDVIAVLDTREDPAKASQRFNN